MAKPFVVKQPQPVPPEPERPVDLITGTENDFNAQSVEEWEERIFRNASYFTVVRKAGVGQLQVQNYADFAAAMINAFPDRRAMIRAVCDSGRSFCIPRQQWQKYYVIWKELKCLPSSSR